MEVRATRLGYYNNRRQREGTKFVLSDKKHFSKLWMEKVGGADKSTKKEDSPKKKDESETSEPTGSESVI